MKTVHHHLDYDVIFLSLLPLIENHYLGIKFFAVILKIIVAWIIHIVFICGGNLFLPVGCVTFQEKGASHITPLEENLAIFSTVVPMASLALSSDSSLKFP